RLSAQLPVRGRVHDDGRGTGPRRRYRREACGEISLRARVSAGGAASRRLDVELVSAGASLPQSPVIAPGSFTQERRLTMHSFYCRRSITGGLAVLASGIAFVCALAIPGAASAQQKFVTIGTGGVTGVYYA